MGLLEGLWEETLVKALSKATRVRILEGDSGRGLT